MGPRDTPWQNQVVYMCMSVTQTQVELREMCHQALDQCTIPVGLEFGRLYGQSSVSARLDASKRVHSVDNISHSHSVSRTSTHRSDRLETAISIPRRPWNSTCTANLNVLTGAAVGVDIRHMLSPERMSATTSTVTSGQAGRYWPYIRNHSGKKWWGDEI